jgi:hypothetical protein
LESDSDKSLPIESFGIDDAQWGRPDLEFPYRRVSHQIPERGEGIRKVGAASLDRILLFRQPKFCIDKSEAVGAGNRIELLHGLPAALRLGEEFFLERESDLTLLYIEEGKGDLAPQEIQVA